MSGGHFQYRQYQIGQIADEVEQLIIDNCSDKKDQWGNCKGRYFTPETMAEFQKGVYLLHLAQIYAQRIDWLVSADDGEDSFHRRLAKDIADLDQRMAEFRDAKHD